MTSLRLLKLLFNDVSVDMIVGYTKLYSHREKGVNSFEITNEKIRLFLSMLLLSGYHKRPDPKIYCEMIPDTFVSAKFDSMSRNTFECILRNLHFYYIKQLDK